MMCIFWRSGSAPASGFPQLQRGEQETVNKPEGSLEKSSSAFEGKHVA
jgi:hypothetical protein